MRHVCVGHPIHPASSALMLLSVAASVSSSGVGAQEVLRPNLADIATGHGWTAADARVEAHGDRAVITPDARQSDGAAWLNDVGAEPSSVVTQLTNRTPGRIGLWMGNNSHARFADLVVPTTMTP